MRIEDIEVTTLLFAYPEASRFRYAGGTCTHRVTSLVEVRTDMGLVGIGCAYSHPELVRIIIEQHLAPHLIGRDPTDVEDLWRDMYQHTRWYGRKGAAISALGALDIAFWDLRGKQAGVPVRKLLGPSRDEVPAYASGLLWAEDKDDLRREAERHIDRGFRRMKMRLGLGPAYDLPALDAVLAATGKNAEVMVDGSMRYTVEEAVALARELSDRGVFWFEEPFEPEHLDRYIELKARSGISIAAGENEFGPGGFQELFRLGAIDIAQADSCRSGGITETLATGKLAAKHGKRLAPHTWSDAIAVIANAQVVAALDNAITVEVDQTGNPFIDDLLNTPLKITEGALALSDAPGLGVELNRSTIERYRWPAGRPLPPGSYSDMAFAARAANAPGCPDRAAARGASLPANDPAP